MALSETKTRKEAVSSLKKSLILDAAQAIFEDTGFEGASMRAIAKRAGYTAGAIYSYFDSKEDIYGALLERSLDKLNASIAKSVNATHSPGRRLQSVGVAFFDFYAERPRDLDLGFYLFRGGMRPHGLGEPWDTALNDKLLQALQPFRQALIDMGCDDILADAETAAFFGHAAGLLLLEHTGRITLFQTDVSSRMRDYLYDLEHRITRALAVAEWQNTHQGGA